MFKRKTTFLYIVLIAALLAPRLPALNSFVTLDEPYWLSMGANFYYALGQREFENTVYEYQPAVTTMWVVTFAMLLYFPQYRGLGQGYLEFEKGALDPFLLEHGKDPLVLLQISRILQVLVIVFLFLVFFYFLTRFLPNPAAFFLVVFASLDPFFLSHSRLLTHEAMLSLFVMISILALAAYFLQEERFIFLLISAVAGALAQLTKSSALAFLLPIGILFLIHLFNKKNPASVVKTFFLWLAMLIAAYFIFWPGMWVAPAKMLYQVYGNAFSYAFQGARLEVTEELDASQFSLEMSSSGIWLHLETFLRRATPFTWIGILLGFLIPASRESAWQPARRYLLGLFWSAAAGFILLFGVAQGRNSPHYILCAYLALNSVAGLGWFYAIHLLNRPQAQTALLAIPLAMQAWSAFSSFPYYFTYENPILANARDNKEFPLFPYGEGLELAAQYLAGLPEAQNSTALVYYSRGCFSYFYPGASARFKPYYIENGHEQDLLNAVQGADYLVVYYAVQGYMPKYQNMLKALAPAQPIHEVRLNGRKYVLIYQVNQFPQSVLDALVK